MKSTKFEQFFQYTLGIIQVNNKNRNESEELK